MKIWTVFFTEHQTKIPITLYSFQIDFKNQLAFSVLTPCTGSRMNKQEYIKPSLNFMCVLYHQFRHLKEAYPLGFTELQQTSISTFCNKIWEAKTDEMRFSVTVWFWSASLSGFVCDNNSAEPFGAWMWHFVADTTTQHSHLAITALQHIKTSAWSAVNKL